MVEPEVSSPPVVLLTGTTASGKTGVSLTLAELLGAEIVSLDSMLVYRGMDIGTAKPTREEQARISHHLIDILDPTEGMNLKRYVEFADAAVADIRSRGRRVLLVGGTALYLHGFLYGVFDGPSADPEFRSRLREEAQGLGPTGLHTRLAGIDPVAARRIHPNDYKRIERALEVFALTGRPISEQQAQWQGVFRYSNRLFVLTHPRATMDARIDGRVDRMMADGLLHEVETLRARGGLGQQAKDALGYRELNRHLDGELTLMAATTEIKTKTRRFARKQLTWFRSMATAKLIERGEESDEVVARSINQQLTESPGPCLGSRDW